ncbi:IS5 family transposase [Bradyrhizobium sp. CIR3A]|nr:IS5 family transposase [Bradyrhizobium sp. CIR3A]
MITPGEAPDVTCAEALLDGLDARAVVIADKGYDADRVRAHIRDQGAIPNIPNRSTGRRGSGGRRPSIASATTLSASSTN